MVIGAPESSWIIDRGADKWNGDEVDAIKSFVAKGGGLLIVGHHLINAEHFNILTSNFSIHFLDDCVDDVTVVDLEKHIMTEGVKEIELGSLWCEFGGNYLGPVFTRAQY
uniref:Uncharacterized protein n=1 Tax=Candidatus Methanogaster sp. ANME-2c ERB4 TaxID=2759911 RepID=A0A7G9YPP7_9EURY|nr:hypothetical protein CAGMOKBG_00001 [Methanosarcinales archaeon ANME-2c ERB4]